MTNLERYRQDLSKLTKLGDEMYLDLSIQAAEKQGKLDKTLKEAKDKVKGAFKRNYQKWYTESCALIGQILPSRLAEFEAFYKADQKRKSVDSTSYTIQDWLMGLRAAPHRFTGEKPFDDFTAVIMRFGVQLEILRSVEPRFESSLFEITQLVQADLFDSELDSTRELLKNGYLRAAGVVAGVILEKHLAQACHNHAISIRKQHPTISDLNDLLKNNNALDVPTWRFIQRLADLRNLCGHNRQREPQDAEVAELIDGVGKITKTLF
jgi:hypothetical protein